MNQSLLEKLKRVHFTDIIQFFIFFLALPFAFFLKRKRRNIWLLSDCSNEARDNAYWFFQYITVSHPSIDAVFALKTSSADYPKVKKKGNVISYGSFKHWIFFLAARNHISSQKNDGPNAVVTYILEYFNLITWNKIFLQHGIIKDNISFLHYKYTHINLFTCSVQREYEYVSTVYGYPQGYVKLLGLCRFDYLKDNSSNSRTILIIPTWRKWLCHPTKGTSTHNLINLFLSSDYYQKWNSFINNSSLNQLLEHYDYNVIFYLHREAQKYSEFFSSSSKKILIAEFPEYDVHDLLISSNILITDYSSVAMDFAYMNKPLFYYQFDYCDYRKRHLAEGYFKYEYDGFGPVYKDESELITSLKLFFKNNFKEDYIYERRRKNFFTLRDGHNCERTYHAIEGLDL